MTALTIYIIASLAVLGIACWLHPDDEWERETWAEQRDRAWGWSDEEGAG